MKTTSLLLATALFSGIALQAQKHDSNLIFGNGIKSCQPAALSVDKANYLYTTGIMTNPMSIGEIQIPAGINPLNNKYFQSLFISKIGADCNPQWGYGILGHKNHLYANNIVVDKHNNSYVLGEYLTDIIVASADKELLTLTPEKPGYCLVKLDAGGTPLWIKALKHGNTTVNGSGDIAIDTNGNILITGSFVNTADFDLSGTEPAERTSDTRQAFVARYSADGSFLWTRTLNGTGSSQGLKIAGDNENNIYVAIKTTGPVLPEGAETATVTDGLLLVKYTSEGHWVWSRQICGDSTQDMIHDLDIQGNRLAVAGSCSSQLLTIQDTEAVNIQTGVSTASNLMLVVLDASSGCYDWHYITGNATSADNAFSVAFGQDSTVWLGGNVTGSFSPGNDLSVESGSREDWFLAHISKQGQLLNAYHQRSNAMEQIRGIATGSGYGKLFLAFNTSAYTPAAECPISLIERPSVMVAPKASNKYSSTIASYSQLVITPQQLPEAIISVGFSARFTVENNDGTTVFALEEGILPEGITLSSDGTLSGTTQQKGMFDILISASDQLGNKGYVNHVLTIKETPSGLVGEPRCSPVICGGKQTIRIEQATDYRLSIYTTSGTLIFQSDMSCDPITIPIACGMYIVQLSSSYEAHASKVVVR